MRNVYHVTKAEIGWKARLIDSDETVVVGNTKEEVMEKTIELAKQNEPSEVVIHNEEGRIEEERTYPRSSDPKGSKG